MTKSFSTTMARATDASARRPGRRTKSLFVGFAVPWALLVAGFSLPCCGPPRVATPAQADSNPAQARAAGHPVPAALPEVVPDSPSDDALWLDGHWSWEGSNWVWQRGGWIGPLDSGVRRALSETWYAEDGTLLFRPEIWLDSSGSTMERPPILVPAGTPPTPTLPEDSTIP